MAGRNYNGSPGNSNLMFNLGPMFQGMDAMRDQRDQERQRRADAIYLNRVRAGLEDPYGQSNFQSQPSYTQNMASRPWGGQQQEDQYDSYYAQTAPTGQQYAYVAGASKPIDMNPQKSAYELLAQRYANQMLDATNPANTSYVETPIYGTYTNYRDESGNLLAKPISSKGVVGASFEEDPNNQFNQQRQQSLTALSNMFNPNRQTGTRSTADQIAIDNNRALNAQDALKMKNDLDIATEKLKKSLSYPDKVVEWAANQTKNDLMFYSLSPEDKVKKLQAAAEQFKQIFPNEYKAAMQSQTQPATTTAQPTPQAMPTPMPTQTPQTQDKVAGETSDTKETVYVNSAGQYYVIRNGKPTPIKGNK